MSIGKHVDPACLSCRVPFVDGEKTIAIWEWPTGKVVGGIHLDMALCGQNIREAAR